MDFFSALGGEFIPVQHDFIDALDTAKSDPHIDALVVKIGPLETGWGKLRRFVRTFLRSAQRQAEHLLSRRRWHRQSGILRCQRLRQDLAGADGAGFDSRNDGERRVFLRGSLDKLKIVSGLLPHRRIQDSVESAHRKEIYARAP